MILINIQRIPLVWDLFISHLYIVSNKRNSSFPQLAYETYFEMLQTIFQNYEKVSDKSEKWDSVNWQNTVLQPFLILIKSETENELKLLILLTIE